MSGFFNLIKAVTAPIEAVVDVVAEMTKLATDPITDGLNVVADGLREITKDEDAS